MGYKMKTPEEILRQNCPSFDPLFMDAQTDDFYKRVLASMHEYAQAKAREMVLEYARWYESNSVAEENQNEDWMIKQNVKSFYDVRL